MSLSWESVDDAHLRALDLRKFNDGRNPYPEHDKSVDIAYAPGKAFMDELIQQRIGFTGGTVLDLMCGFGRWIPPLAACNRKVIGVERYESAVRLAGNLLRYFGIDNAEVLCGDISLIETFEPESFDTVFIWGGLMLVDRRYVMEQSRRLLRPGGRLFSGSHTSTGLVIEHVMNGGEQGKLFEGRFKHWLAALDRGPMAHQKLNFADLETVGAACTELGYTLLGAAPSGYLDLRVAGWRRAGWERETHFGPYYRTIEFVAQSTAEDKACAGGDGATSEKPVGAAASIARRFTRNVANLRKFVWR